MKNHPRLVEVEALEAFTVTRPYGQFHGDPASKRNRHPLVPEDALRDLVDRRKVRVSDSAVFDDSAQLIGDDGKPVDMPEGSPDDEPESLDLTDEQRANLSQLDHDGDGEPGGSTSGGEGEDIDALRTRYKEVVGKNFFPGWSAEELRAKIAAHEAEASESDESADDDEAPSD